VLLTRAAPLSAITTIIRQYLFAIAQPPAKPRSQQKSDETVMFKLMRSKLATRRLRAICTVRRLTRREDGTAAVEFGMVAAPFLLLVFAIMETALVFFAGQALETAVADSARLIMTGQAQTKGFDQAAFKNAVCAKIYGLFDCANGVSVDVQTYTSFAGVNLTPPLDASGNFQNNQGYNPGGPGSIVVVRLFYQWPIYVSLLQNMAGHKRLLIATSAFRNEPYGN
jgi:Flp pilus assembly protein TadG